MSRRWTFDPIRKCMTRRGWRIYLPEATSGSNEASGWYLISDCETWVPGGYDSFAAAELALETSDEILVKLRDRLNFNGKPITLDDLRRAPSHHQGPDAP